MSPNSSTISVNAVGSSLQVNGHVVFDVEIGKQDEHKIDPAGPATSGPSISLQAYRSDGAMIWPAAGTIFDPRESTTPRVFPLGGSGWTSGPAHVVAQLYGMKNNKIVQLATTSFECEG